MSRSVWLLAMLLGVFAMNANAAPEYSIKAGYILLFTRYVEWPNDAFASPHDSIEVCILGQDPFGSVLDQTLAGQQSQGRSLSVRRITNTRAASDCHVVYMGTKTLAEASGWLEQLASQPVLTITEQHDALMRGAALCFVNEGAGEQLRIRFEASLASIQKAKLTASSEMLVAARKVHDVGI